MQHNFGQKDASFQAAGQFPGIEKLVHRFYDLMETLPEAQKIRDIHPKDLTTSREKLTHFLCLWMGGPEVYRDKFGPTNIPRAHAHLKIGIAERDAWLLCMKKAAADQAYPKQFQTYLLAQLSVPAERVRNSD